MLTPDQPYYIYRWSGTDSNHHSAFERDSRQAITGSQEVTELIAAEPAPPVNSAQIAEASPMPPATASLSQNHPGGVPAYEGLPVVSCVMPTYGRPDFVAESIAMFLAQDYSAKELIILNDCPGQKLLGDFPDVRIFNCEARWPTLGEKRNAAIELARGQYIAVWDDDDIYMPWRLSHSMRRIHELNTPLYCPADYWAYWGSEELHENQALLNWIYHPLVVFDKELWRAAGGYPAQTLGEDTGLFKKVLNHLGIEWPRDPISRHDRVMIMRAKSKYAHTSISGGTGAPDTTQGDIPLTPSPIDDPTLRLITDSLIKRRARNAVRASASRKTIDSLRQSASGSSEVWLDTLSPESASVGFGAAGVGGSLGYEGRDVEVCGEQMAHAISAHAPSRLVYALEGRFQEFRSRVAINDTAPDDATLADFYVLTDGSVSAVAKNVRPGQVPRIITVDVRGIQRLELLAQTRRWSSCHTVWVDPVLINVGSETACVVVDALKRAEITFPPGLPLTELCIATVGSRGYEDWVDDLFGSVCANAQCPHAMLAVFSFGDSAEIRRVAQKYAAQVIPCRALRRLSVSSKSVLYAAGSGVPAKRFICLDADMLVLDDLRPIAAMIDASPPGSILTCREAAWARDLEQAVATIYAGVPEDITTLTGDEAALERRYSFIVNDGIFAGTRAALLALDHQIRCLNQPEVWVDDPVANTPWRNQFVLNLALAQADCGVELDSRYNVQAQSQQTEFVESTERIFARTHGMPASIVHFNGGSKHHSPEWRGRYGKIARPLIHADRETPSFGIFLQALRTWLGTRGCDALAWSYYGTLDGQAGRDCPDPEFPLLATLYYLIRSNGGCRVIETGTARGISSACLATAVAHCPGSKVVTIDNCVFPDREPLWRLLPDSIRCKIEPRQADTIVGLKSAFEAGESYDAAILDSVHTAEHVLGEFEYARQLVCRGGLILIHDAVLASGTVGAALEEISNMGYEVIRLWTAESGCQADAGIGMAVIENRCRFTAPQTSVRGDSSS